MNSLREIVSSEPSCGSKCAATFCTCVAPVQRSRTRSRSSSADRKVSKTVRCAGRRSTSEAQSSG